MLKLFEEREKRILGAKLQARKLDEGSADALTKVESEMQRARTAGNVERDKLRAEGVKVENEVLAKVRASTTETLDAGRKRLAEDIVTARAALKADAANLAKELAGRVLGRPVQRVKILEHSAFGAGALADVASGFFDEATSGARLSEAVDVIAPRLDEFARTTKARVWAAAEHSVFDSTAAR